MRQDGGGMTNWTEGRAWKSWRKSEEIKKIRNKEKKNFEGGQGEYAGHHVPIHRLDLPKPAFLA